MRIDHTTTIMIMTQEQYYWNHIQSVVFQLTKTKNINSQSESTRF